MASNPPIDGPSTASPSEPPTTSSPPATSTTTTTTTTTTAAPPTSPPTPPQPTLTHPDPLTTTLSTPTCHATLTSLPLSPTHILSLVRSPHSGATVLFSGTTRSTFGTATVTGLSYSAYTPLALKSMLRICTEIQEKYEASGVAITHRLGEVGVGEESILVAIGTKHRGGAWRGGEEALERCKGEVEVWKMERFEGGGVWRANRDGGVGELVMDGVGNKGMEGGDAVEEEGKGETVVVRSDPLPEEEDTRRPDPPIERGHGPVVHGK
ncbi:hypothetical protein VE03_06607 [Pseudogymnoascus sp. 23342-1-I1]|nr:hypothetical protein VE03_06607 [Pseudogymnoascus sp. 23342-1-I1]